MSTQRLNSILTFFSKDKEFVWGTRDCCMWVADILKCKTGVDYAINLRGTYTNQQGFKKLLIKENKKDLVELVTSILGEPIEGFKARKGQAVLLQERGEYLLGMCYGTYALFLTDKGFNRRSIVSCLYSWEI